MISGLILDTLNDEFLIHMFSIQLGFEMVRPPLATPNLIVIRDDAQLEDMYMSAGAPLSSIVTILCFVLNMHVCIVHIPTSSNRRYLYERGS